MSKLKKTALAVLALGSSTVALAGTMGPVCTPGPVTIPCERTAWDFAGQALYLQPANTNYHGFYRTAERDIYNNPRLNWGWGFQLEGSYHFNTGNDIDINWFHWNRETRRSHVIFFGEADDPFAVGDNIPVTLRTEPRWDAVNVEFGQRMDFDELKHARFHAGVQYARVKAEATGYTSGLALPLTTTYNGFGPRVGVDLSYDIGNGFSIFGNGGTALLIGTSKFTDAITPNTPFTSSGSKTQLVPEMEAKLGATYTYPMAQGDITLDAGWVWVNYFNAQQIRFDNTDFGLQGLFFGAKWVGNII